MSRALAALRVRSLAASILVAMSARMNEIDWCLEIGFPKVFLSLAYVHASSIAPLAFPTAAAATAGLE